MNKENNQISQPEEDIIPQKEKKIILPIILTALITLIIVGVAMYFIMSRVYNNQSQDEQESIEDIENLSQKTYQDRKQEIDSDNDGLSDSRELQIGSNPNNPDTDGDGYLDGNEVANGYDPLVDEKAQAEFVNWQIYINEEHGFEFKYPEGWEVKTIQTNTIQIQQATDNIDPYGNTVYKYINLSIKEAEENTSLTDWINKNDLISKIISNEYKTNYLKGTKYIEFGTTDYLSISFKNYNNIYIFSVIEHMDYRDMIEKIASTFKFSSISPEENCEFKDGEWAFEHCFFRTKDAGKKCIESSQCESICFLNYVENENELLRDENGYLLGKCYLYDSRMGGCGGELKEPIKFYDPLHFGFCLD